MLKNRGKAEPIIVDGYSNFLFLNQSGLPKVAASYESMLKGLVKNIMGHSNISMTLNYYAHASFDSAKEEMERLIA